MADDGTPGEVAVTVLGAHLNPREGRLVWSGGLVDLLAQLGFTEGAARVALARLVQRDLLARTKRGRHVHYSLTIRALAVLSDGDRRIFLLGKEKPAATVWTVLWHTIPEEHRRSRERLVRRLRFLGFGQVQDGTWIAPHDRETEVAALLDELSVTEHAGLLLGAPSAVVDVRTVLARAWDLDAVAAGYTGFVARFGEYTTARARRDLDDRGAFALRTRLTHTFRQFPFLDPELPDDLVPPPADRARAVRLFHDLYAALEPPAQRHFDEVTAHE
ncbi:PaaX family transcriptional regulator C-terminal domain-containing protein [Herbihabitans rhizosphaerae]|uniref:PaaX family transcriptional regulator n=1 Tax=Herbihabitans rhizosphaerae TaxID=1872711 RepID=UPI001F5F041C|nr:PaaX family transcriptional regulator C-terminal domain-containing protein [Herbihabitans rhizosphaerae]